MVCIATGALNLRVSVPPNGSIPLTRGGYPVDRKHLAVASSGQGVQVLSSTSGFGFGEVIITSKGVA